MGEKVVALRDDVVSHGRAPDQDTIKMLTDFLEEAKSGDLRGFAIAAVYGNGASRNDWTGDSTVLQTMAAVSLLFAEYSQAILRSSEE